MGKRPLVRRRGRGGMQFRASKTGKISPAKYPNFDPKDSHVAEIIDLVHERGRDVPLAKIRLDDGSISFLPAVIGSKVGSKIQFGYESGIVDGNVNSIQNIPDGTTVCNVEKQLGDGGSFIKSAGTAATVFSHGDDGINERPFMRAGVKWRKFRSRGKKYPIVRGVAQGAYVHPHGGGRHQHVGQSSTVARDAPPGAKVGSIAARKTGRARIKERKGPQKK